MLRYSQEDDYDWVRTRLNSSVVRNDQGEPVFVVACRRNQATVINLVKGGQESVDIDTLNATPIETLGWSIYKDNPLYLFRTPARRYRQGLSWATLQSNNNLAVQTLRRLDEVTSYKVLLLPMGFFKYPSEKEALNCLQDCWDFVPIHRNWGINQEFQVFYKSFPSPVGTFNPTTREYKLNKNKQYLQEVLEQDLLTARN